MSWHVLASPGGYFGRTWEILNSAPRRPRIAVVDLQAADLYPSRESAAADATRARAVLSIDFEPAPVALAGRWPDARIVLLEPAP